LDPLKPLKNEKNSTIYNSYDPNFTSNLPSCDTNFLKPDKI